MFFAEYTDIYGEIFTVRGKTLEETYDNLRESVGESVGEYVSPAAISWWEGGSIEVKLNFEVV